MHARELFCWGRTLGLPVWPARGDSEWTSLWERSPVTRIPLHDEPRAVAVGEEHTCVLHEDGTVHCSGREGGDGRLGFEDCRVEHAVDHPVSLLAPATDIAIDDGWTCALLEDGRVECWGSPAPGVPVRCGPRLVETEAGRALRGCARMDAGACVDAGGEVWVWGAPGGRAGTAPLRASRAEGLGRAREVAVTGEVVCVIDEAGAVACTRDGAAIAAPFRGKARAIDCGGEGCCVITADGALSCWGNPGLSAAVSGATDVRRLALSWDTLCWSTGDEHEVWCAGDAPSVFGAGARDDAASLGWDARPIPLDGRSNDPPRPPGRAER